MTHLLFGRNVYRQHGMTSTGTIVHVMTPYCSVFHAYTRKIGHVFRRKFLMFIQWLVLNNEWIDNEKGDGQRHRKRMFLNSRQIRFYLK